MTRKRWAALVAAGVIFLAMVFLVERLGALLSRPAAGPWVEVTLQGTGSDKVAVIEVEGEIVDESEGDQLGAAAAEDLVSQLRQARLDDDVKAVVLEINTPGGSVVASDEVHREVLDVREAGKPVIAQMGEVAASGGYYIAAGADRIVANPNTFTGSIGVILVLLNLERAAGKLGIEPIIVKSGRIKDIGSPFRDLTPEERGILQGLIDQAYDRFVRIVANGRDLPLGEVREIADGRPLSGLQAEGLGLVDALGGFDDAISEARRLAGIEQATVVEYRPPAPSLADLLGRGPFLGVASTLEDLERRVGVTGPVLKYLYVA